MILLGILIGLGIIAAMVFLALDKKSNFATRAAALGALAIMILTIIICLFLVLTDDRVPVDESVLIVGAVPETKEKDSSSFMVLLLLTILMLIMFAVVVLLSMREHKKSKPKISGGSVLAR